MALRSGDITRRVVRDVDLDATVLRVYDGKTLKSNRPRKIPEVLQPLLRKLVDGRQPFEPLFRTPYTETGHHTRRWLEEAMVRFCKAADVPYVCPHALKGTAATLLAQAGELADRIADHLSHEEASTTAKHYVARGAIEQAQVTRAFAVIAGGRAMISSAVSCAGGKTERLTTGGSSQNRTENLTRMKTAQTRNLAS